jgi:hypothetical protein
MIQFNYFLFTRSFIGLIAIYNLNTYKQVPSTTIQTKTSK